MKPLFLALTFALSSAAHAGLQQDKMKSCNQQAVGKKGDERKAFMKGCLSAKAEAPPENAVTSPQLRMKECNEQAKGKKGDERRGFMKTCLSAH